MTDLQAASTQLLQELIRFDTVNPPGDERAAQEHLAAKLRDAGFEIGLLGRTEARPNLVARLRGAADGPTLALLSHVDTVYATAADWEHDPWSGDLADGCVWGRGALDMKSQTAAEIAAALELAHSGWRPAAGDLLIVVLVDEETGGADGAQWICEHHPDAVRCDYVLNEGAGSVIPYDGGRYLGVCVAEKGVFRFRLTVDGVAGHASIPKIGDNALLKVAPLLDAMRDRQPSFDVTDGPRALLEGLGLDPGDPAAALRALEQTDPALAVLVEPMLGVTLAPTRIWASEKINVIPASATIGVDCRVPPGLDRELAHERVVEVLGSDPAHPYRLDWSEQVMGNASPVDSPLMDAIRDWVAANDPETTVVPTILPGFTDSRTFRATFPDVVAYGFFPHKHMTLHETAPLIHSADERIDVRDLGHAAAFFRDTARRLLG
ncbi:MAG TPA: M20/M25/M40 family metallo-hydrolase [Capillimicrobium sp.]|jgi:acetylornithine deacetylase/succinyl-diaminopimelate desuccinylase-like protein